MTKQAVLKVIGSLVLVGGLSLFGGTASAAICTSVDPFTDPDATLTNSTFCGSGSGGQNATATLLQAAIDAKVNSLGDPNDFEYLVGLGWNQLDKDEKSADGSAGWLRSTPVGAGPSGSWAIDTSTDPGIPGTTDPLYDVFVIVIKDGATLDKGKDVNQWFWFVVDTASGCGSSSFNGFPYCGTWEMYGTDGVDRKDISNMRLFGANGGGTTIIDVPEPATLSLVALSLLGMGAVTRRRTRG